MEYYSETCSVQTHQYLHCLTLIQCMAKLNRFNYIPTTSIQIKCIDTLLLI